MTRLVHVPDARQRPRACDCKASRAVGDQRRRREWASREGGAQPTHKVHTRQTRSRTCLLAGRHASRRPFGLADRLPPRRERGAAHLRRAVNSPVLDATRDAASDRTAGRPRRRFCADDGCLKGVARTGDVDVRNAWAVENELRDPAISFGVLRRCLRLTAAAATGANTAFTAAHAPRRGGNCTRRCLRSRRREERTCAECSPSRSSGLHQRARMSLRTAQKVTDTALPAHYVLRGAIDRPSLPRCASPLQRCRETTRRQRQHQGLLAVLLDGAAGGSGRAQLVPHRADP